MFPYPYYSSILEDGQIEPWPARLSSSFAALLPQLNLLEDRQGAVVDLQRADGEAGLGDAAAGVGVLVAGGPGAGDVAAVFLALDEEVPHGGVPFLPFLAAEVVQRLRAVVPVIDIGGPLGRQVLVHEPPHAAPQGGVALPPAEIHAAEEGFGGHGGGGGM